MESTLEDDGMEEDIESVIEDEEEELVDEMDLVRMEAQAVSLEPARCGDGVKQQDECHTPSTRHDPTRWSTHFPNDRMKPKMKT